MSSVRFANNRRRFAVRMRTKDVENISLELVLTRKLEMLQWHLSIWTIMLEAIVIFISI